MALSNYAELQSTVLGWVRRPDLSGESVALGSGNITMNDVKSGVKDFIRLAESQLNRALRCEDMSTVTTLTVSSGEVSLPTDFRQAETVRITSDPTDPITLVSKDSFDAKKASGGKPCMANISGGKLRIKPWSSDFDVDLRYFQSIPALSDDNTTNWLLTKHPDMYLWSTLLVVEMYGVNDDRLKSLAPLRRATIDEINEESYATGTFVPAMEPTVDAV